jgi:hypothetical protein
MQFWFIIRLAASASHRRRPVSSTLGIAIQMSSPTRTKFAVAEPFPEGGWYTDVSRFARLAHKNLARLEQLTTEAKAKWPQPPNSPVSDASPEFEALVEERDAASDVTILFAAMAIEAFLNFYGSVRLGEAEYQRHFERLGLVPKLQQLLLICDCWSVAKSDPLVVALQVVAQGRNELAHPKAWKDLPGTKDKLLKPIPGAAQQAVRAMTSFFDEFKSLLPESRHFMPL